MPETASTDADLNADPRADRVLVVEDDEELAHLLEIHLNDQGYAVDLAHDGRTGLEHAQGNAYALLILDLMLPELDGVEVCKRVRADDDQLPILMLTARSEETDKVLGLEMGADDYVTKPFSIRELMARVKALFRRVEVDREAPDEDQEEIAFGPLRIAPPKRKVWLSEDSLELTAKEFDLLLLLARHPGRAYNRQELLDQVWGYQYEGYSHTVNTHINRLRSKIEEEPSDPRFVQTVWGVGYRFAEREELATS
jgi:DNA-binding response OmpR family regulator